MEAHVRDGVEIVLFTDRTSAWHKFNTDSTIVRLGRLPGDAELHTPKERMRAIGLMVLYRREDVSGVSGTGPVAEIGRFSDGVCAMRWLTATASTAIYSSLEELIAIHGHGGATEVRDYRPDGRYDGRG
jgi:hypothetical protein